MQTAPKMIDYLSHCAGPYGQHCAGWFGPAHHPYLAAPVLAIGVSRVSAAVGGVSTADEIRSFDAAEVAEAYLGQTNAIAVSSFCGPHGLIWGLDLVPAAGLNRQHPLAPPLMPSAGQRSGGQSHCCGVLPQKSGQSPSSLSVSSDARQVAVLDLDPLLQASRSLFGTVDGRRFPLWPGSHVPTALRTFCDKGPAHLFSAIAIGVPADRRRDARCFVEDVGTLPSDGNDDQRRAAALQRLVSTVLRVAEQQRIVLESVYCGVRDRVLARGEFGCALAAIPYFLLAKHAVPGADPASLADCSLLDWTDRVKAHFVDPM